MGKLYVVAKREYLERVRSRWFLVITLAVPALMSTAAGETPPVLLASLAPADRIPLPLAKPSSSSIGLIRMARAKPRRS